MQGSYLYEYAVIRFLPKVEREEFINVGVILFCKRRKYLRSMYQLDQKKIALFASEVDTESLHGALRAFDKICQGEVKKGPIVLMDVAERFRWLTAMRSASIQTSRPHPGFSSDLDETLQRLFEELVL